MASDHPASPPVGGSAGLTPRSGRTRRAGGADAVLDVGRAGAVGGQRRVDHIGRVDAARGLLGRGDRLAVRGRRRPRRRRGATSRCRSTRRRRPFPDRCPSQSSRHPLRLAVPAPPAGSRASESSTTSPTTMIAGLTTSSRSTMSPRSASRVRIARLPSQRAALQHRDRHVGGDAVGHQLVGDQPRAGDAHVDDQRAALAGEARPILLGTGPCTGRRRS